MSLPRGTGWKRDVRIDPGTLTPRYLAGATPGRADRMVQLFTREDVRDQGQVGSCTGQARTYAVHARLRALGIRSERPSAMNAYVGGRLWPQRHNEEARLFDEGAHPWDCVSSSLEWGECAESVYPYDEAQVNVLPPAHVVQNASGHRVRSWKRIQGAGTSRTDEMKRCLAADYPIIFGLDLSGDIAHYQQGVWNRDFGAQSNGLHMLCALGYEAIGVHVLNSWGTDWGASGWILIGWETFQSWFVGDLYAIDCTPPDLDGPEAA